MTGAKHEVVYEITIEGRLDEQWSDWFDGMVITCHPAERDHIVTILTGPVVDQAALHGLLIKIRDLNLELVSVWRVR